MDFKNLLKEAQKMQASLAKVEKELDSYTYTSGGNGIDVEINGKYEVVKLTIDEELLNKDNKEMIEELLMITLNRAYTEAKETRDKKMGELTAGVKMPGLF